MRLHPSNAIHSSSHVEQKKSVVQDNGITSPAPSTTLPLPTSTPSSTFEPLIQAICSRVKSTVISKHDYIEQWKISVYHDEDLHALKRSLSSALNAITADFYRIDVNPGTLFIQVDRASEKTMKMFEEDCAARFKRHGGGIQKREKVTAINALKMWWHRV